MLGMVSLSFESCAGNGGQVEALGAGQELAALELAA